MPSCFRYYQMIQSNITSGCQEPITWLGEDQSHLLYQDLPLPKQVQNDCQWQDKPFWILHFLRSCLCTSTDCFPTASDAPVNDLMLLRRIKQYAVIKNNWYLGSEMAPLSLFSCKVSDDEKKLIAEAMICRRDDCSVTGIWCPVATCDQLEKRQLHELVKSSSAALQSLGLNIAALSSTIPQTWGRNCWALRN